MNIEIFEATKPEQLYTFTQSSQIASQTGCLGHLRADFGEDGTEFHTSWEDQCGYLKTDAFKAQFNEIIEELRSGTDNGKLLSTRANLARFCFVTRQQAYRRRMARPRSALTRAVTPTSCGSIQIPATITSISTST